MAENNYGHNKDWSHLSIVILRAQKENNYVRQHKVVYIYSDEVSMIIQD